MQCPLPPPLQTFHRHLCQAHLHDILALQVTQLRPQCLRLFPLSSNGRLKLLRLPLLPGNRRLQLARLLGGRRQRCLALLLAWACMTVVAAA